MSTPGLDSLTVQLLAWIDARPRTYAETMAAWRTSCPRMPVWEDATSDGLVEVVAVHAGMDAAVVRLTPAGRSMLVQPAE
jgi:hypothetical protein